MKSGKTKPYMSDVVLIVDAMELHKAIWWDQKKMCYIGRVDYDTVLPEVSDNLAAEALVFMIGSITGHWKHPIGYFLQSKISASDQAQLKDCIFLLHDEDLFVTALVFDGMFGNQSTATQLGCIMDLSNIQTWFPHPQIVNAKVHVTFDVCHMIKLMQNLLSDQKCLSP